MKFKRFLPVALLFTVSLFAQNEEKEIGLSHGASAVAAELDYNFFWNMFEDNLDRAYKLAQTEDFEIGSMQVLTNEMAALANERMKNPKIVDKVQQQLASMAKLEIEINKLPREEQLKVIEKWRYLFLEKLEEAVRHRASLKARWSLTLASQTTYDSNVNRVPDGINAAVNLSGKDDIQQTFLASFVWKPFVNRKSFAGKRSFKTAFNLVRISQSDHKENEVQLFEIRPEYTKKVRSDWLKEITGSYRFQHFMLSGDVNSRAPSKYYRSHRFAVDFVSGEWKGYGFFKTASGTTTLAYATRAHYDDVNEARDADEMMAGYAAKLGYDSRNGINILSAAVEYFDYSTDSAPTSDYKRLETTIGHNHRVKLGKVVHLNQSLRWRNKKFGSGGATEDLIGVSCAANMRITQSAGMSLGMTYNNIDNSSTDSADQFQITLGINWVQP